MKTSNFRWLILTDIHANLPALEAVLATPEARRCSRVISLGDQVNFGPKPREVLQRLRGLDAILLRGNHEDRLTRVDDFPGYGYGILRFTAEQTHGEDYALPLDFRAGKALFTHGSPGDPWHLVDAATVAPVLDTLPDGVTWLISGHNHVTWRVERGGRTAFNPGSVGVDENGVGGMASFAVAEELDTAPRVTRFTVPYDVERVRRDYLETGAAAACPEMTRAILQTMRTGEPWLGLRFARFVAETAARLGLTPEDEAAWRAADLAFDGWTEKGVSAREVWGIREC